MKNKDKLKEYSRKVDAFAWYGKGNVFEIAHLAKELNRNYTEDITERKLARRLAMKPIKPL